MPQAEPRSAALTLPAELTIRQAGPLRAQLLPYADSPQPLALDAAAVTQVDAAGLQVLAAFCRSRPDAHWSWQQPSAALIEAATLLQLDRHLRLSPTAEN